ncbi:MAG: Asp-tRNA(Asn)/Glu-tRNA(Gln) amidotransferase subunit GatB, partial [Bdellovibrionales bacterium]|nr:Asp-tRNA(Asn)/Glu-tRNA(Gln) amidotransferase subunit GatB [Bdellovibrionales bacterium]
AYLRALRQIVTYLQISDGNMEEGSLRCDANISLRPAGEMKFGTRTEIKNLNSFKFVERALEYEIARQLSILKRGEQVIQETLLFDSDAGVTRAMRGKEESDDYRYFPDPDLPPLTIEERRIREIRANMPKFPDELREELILQFGLSEYDARVITAERSFVRYFQAAVEVCSEAKIVCNWITSELFGALKREGIEFENSPVNRLQLGKLVELIHRGTISGKMGKAVFEEMFNSGVDPEVIIERKGLKQLTDPLEIAKIVEQAFSQNVTQRDNLLGGEEKLLGFFVGKVMKATGGTANPQVVNDVITREIKRLRGEKE